MTVEQINRELNKLVEIFRGRKSQYGDNYWWFGSVMDSLFPQTLELRGACDWRIMGLLVQIVSKVTRLPNLIWPSSQEKNLERALTDTLQDIAVYAMLLKECVEGRKRGEVKEDVHHSSQ